MDYGLWMQSSWGNLLRVPVLRMLVMIEGHCETRQSIERGRYLMTTRLAAQIDIGQGVGHNRSES